ncbi:MAG: F0F1 ATP synthase subunit A [Candidatus Omnitrophica bacterium]|nr:F0F1 ATP synthase subunit A [Candidatus Omnitrophota bacterium]
MNLWLLFRVLEMGLKGKADLNLKNKIRWLLTLKFPVLYLAGFLVLKTRFFPVEGILTGLTLFLAAFTFGWMRANVRPKSLSLFLFLTPFAFPAGTSFASEAQAAAGQEGARQASLHILNFVHLAAEALGDTPLAHFLERFENVIFCVIVIAFLSLVFFFASRGKGLVPGRLRAALEAVVEALNNLVCGILGPQGRKYTPFVGTLFLYILTMNLMGLVPLMKSPTSSAMTLKLGLIQIPVPTVTAALALVVFFYVQFIGMKEQGLLGYLDHMAGNPRDVFGFVLMPVMLVIHVIGELAKPLSLAFRLYGNIWGEDVLLAVFIGLGVGLLAFLPIPAGAPIQFPFMLLAMVTGTIQAFVFTLLSTVYIAMMLPHGEEHS